MPLYDYRCDKCDETFEVLQKFSDEPLKVHEGCGGHVERLLSPPVLQFKGSGWYVTDYGKGGRSPSTASNGHSESKKSESKPASSSSSEK